MFDISATGSSVYIKTAAKISANDGSGILITHFSDEGTPFEATDVDFSTNVKNLNGDMISSRTPSVYTVSVTVIPNSLEDVALTRFAQMNALQPGNVTPVSQLAVESIFVSVPALNASEGADTSNSLNGAIQFKWTNGRLKSGPTGPSTSAEGRLAARTFTFEMEKFEVSSGRGSSISGLQR